MGHKLKKRDREIIHVYAYEQGVQCAHGARRRVSLTLVMGPRNRRPDPDAFWKSLLDALAACGLITDDDERGVELGAFRTERGPEQAAVITLEDLEC